MNEVWIELIKGIAGVATPVLLLYLGKKYATKLDVIHTLVNSNMTAAMMGELDALKRDHASMTELIDIKRDKTGREPSSETLATLLSIEHRMDELRGELDDRLRTNITTQEVPTKTD